MSSERLDNKIIGQVVRKLRDDNGYTQQKLGELAGCSRSAIAQLERGAMAASLETLSDVARALGVNLSYIILKAEGIDKDEQYELETLKADLPEAITLLKKSNEELTKRQKKELIDFMSFYFNQSKERNKDN